MFFLGQRKGSPPLTDKSKGIRAISFIDLVMQVRYSSTGGMYVTASKDGAVRLWDGVTANCVRSMVHMVQRPSV